MDKEDLLARTKDFALDIVKFVTYCHPCSSIIRADRGAGF